MPYPLDQGSIVMITVEGKLYGQQVITTFPYRRVSVSPTPDGRPEIVELLSEFVKAGGLYEKLLKCMSVDVTGIVVRGQKIHNNRQAYVQGFPTKVKGEATASAVASNVAIAVVKQADAATRHGRGVLHIPGIPTTFLTNGELNAVGLLPYIDFRDALPNTLTTPTGSRVYEPIIFDRVTPSASQILFQAQLKLPTRTMHRRTVGVGS